MPLVINSVGSGYTYTNMYTDDLHTINFKKPDMSTAYGRFCANKHVCWMWTTFIHLILGYVIGYPKTGNLCYYIITP